jgi:hypothetical protein
MDFLDPAKKRAHTIRLFVGYALVGIAIVIGSLILLFQSYGYDLDRKTGNVIQNGLIFLSAHPVGANIFVNGKSQGQTDARLALPAGQYTVELAQKGYRSWKRTFTLDGGSIERLAYPVLFPEKLTTSDVQLYSATPVFASESPDRHWVLVQQPQAFGSFDVYDLSSTNPTPTPIALPDNLLSPSSGAQNLQLVEWSTDNRHVLVRHDFTGSSEYIMIDRQTPASSLNLTKALGVNPSKLTLRDKKYDQYYMYDSAAKTLQAIDLKDKQAVSYLAKVLAYKSYGADVMEYVVDDGTVPGKVQLKLKEGNDIYTLRTFSSGTEYLLDLAQYSGDWYVVAGAKGEGIISVFKNPQSTLKNHKELAPLSVLRVENPQFISFSADTQLVAVQSGVKFGVYDIEADRRYYYELKPLVALDRQAKWMDGDRLSIENDNKTLVFDYDGINQQTLAANDPSFDPFFDRDYTTLYDIGPSVTVPSRAALTSTSLKVK